jgi:hypothetical protein
MRLPNALMTGAVGVAALIGLTAPPAGAAAKAASSAITVTIKNPTAATVSKSFVGLTFEASTFGSPYLDPTQSNLPSYLAELGQGNLRFGGQSSELTAAWQPDPNQPLPSWATTGITPSDLTTVGNLARATGWSVDLGVNLLYFNPAAAANEVMAAQSAFGSSLHDVEIGNEPDLYFYFLTFIPPVEGVPTTFPAYKVNWDAYQSAIESGDPGVSIAGPDFYFTGWLPDLHRRTETGMSELTQHFYPWQDCGGAVVTPDQVLSQSSITSEDSMIKEARVAAKKGDLPLVLDELNSISCGSSSPAAYQFDSSLWAVHALLEAASKGVSSVNMQMDPDNCDSYTPLCVPDPSAPSTLQAQPIFYGMQLVSSLEGGTFLKTRMKRAHSLPAGVSEYAVRLPNGNVSVVVDNTTSTDVTNLNLELDSAAQVVSIQQLAAPSIDSTDGVTLTTSTPSTSSPTDLTVPAGSAEVFTLSP